MIQETRRWDDNKEYSYAMRSKEDAQGLPVFSRSGSGTEYRSDDDWLEAVSKAAQPELRTEKLERYKKEFDIPDYDAEHSDRVQGIWQTCLRQLTAICHKPKESIQLAHGRDSAVC